MSYARRDATSDVHVINAGERVECCNCSLGPDFAGTREEMLAHLEAHVAAGHTAHAVHHANEASKLHAEHHGADEDIDDTVDA